MATGAVPAPARTRGLALVGLILLLLLGVFFLYGAVSDLIATVGGNIPADHHGTFTSLAGVSYSNVKAASPGIAGYIPVLERGYALHELTFALLFIAVLAIPFRRRQRWAWWAAWLPMIANLGYTFTFGTHDQAILTRSLIADIALPLLLVAHIPAFFTRRGTQPRAAGPSASSVPAPIPGSSPRG
jgi:hypothetical protein